MDTSAITESVRILGTGDGTSFAAVAAIVKALAGVVAAAAFVGMAIAVVRAVSRADDSVGLRRALADAARMPLGMLAISFVLMAGGGIWQAVNANSAETQLKMQAGITQAGAKNGQLTKNAFVPSNSEWKATDKTSWNWANNPAYPQYNFKENDPDFIEEVGYDRYGNYTYKVGSTQMGGEAWGGYETVTVNCPAEFK